MSNITKEMEAWLGTNRTAYEWYLVHAMMHDRSRAVRLINVPLTAADFTDEATALTFSALRLMHTLALATAVGMSYPPDALEMMDALRLACEQDETPHDIMQEVLAKLPQLLQRESMESRWPTIDPYFEAWLTSARVKVLARQAQMKRVPDTIKMVTQMQADLSAARAAVAPVVDDMQEIFDGEDEDQVIRRPTGIAPLDTALCGGWGEKEFYIVFSGTGGGKSALAGQCAWHEASTGGYPLIVSTELQAREYVSRIISCSCSVPISDIQDCRNFKQIKLTVAQNMSLMNRLSRVEVAFATLRARLRVHKVRAEEGLNAKTLLESHMLQYFEEVGHMPTLVILDWLGTLADSKGGGTSSAERSRDWEFAAHGCAQFADNSGIPTVVLAQGTNDTQIHRVLTQQQIAVGKGILKEAVAGIGITNFVDKDSIVTALKGKGDMPKLFTPNEQLLCMVKARKGENSVIQINRDFLYQRFTVPAPR